MAEPVTPPPVHRRTVPGRPGAPAEGRVLRARGQATVRRLLDAGVEVFGTKGFHQARVDDIVKVARTSHGTFYLYFASKEDLFRSLTLDVAEELRALAEVLEPVTPDAAGLDALRTWLGEFADFHAHYGVVIRAWTEAELEESSYGAIGTAALGAVTDAIAAQVGPAELAVDPRAAALVLVAMIERFHYYAMAGHVRTTPDAMLDTLARVTFAALHGAAALA